MPRINPRRSLTKRGKSDILDSLRREDFTGDFYAAKCFLVASVVINPLTHEITSVVLNSEGLAEGVAMPVWADVVTSGAGKLYTATAVMTDTLTSQTAPQTISGIMVAMDATPATALAFLELDDDIVLNETGEIVQFALEAGFDGQSFYIVPRVLNLGA